MPDLVRLAYDPFLPEVRDTVRELGPDVATLLRSPLYDGVRRRAVERVERALGKTAPPAQILDERDALQELLSHAVARMLVVLIGDRMLASRYAEAEAALTEASLAGDRDDARLAEAAAALGVAMDLGEGGWRIHMADYLRIAPSEPGWKLVEQGLDRGWLTLGRAGAVRLVREALERKTTRDLESEMKRPLPDEVKAALAPYAEALAPGLEEARESWNTGDFGPVQPGLFPPCVKELFEAMKRGENLPHQGRFAFATFLGTVGWNAEQILDYIAATPNFDREKSRYQIEHLTGQRGVDAYTPPGCSTMQTHGICPLAKRDGLCAKVKHPLSYYRAKIRFQKLDEEKAARLAGKAPPAAAPTTPAPTSPNPSPEAKA